MKISFHIHDTYEKLNKTIYVITMVYAIDVSFEVEALCEFPQADFANVGFLVLVNEKTWALK